MLDTETPKPVTKALSQIERQHQGLLDEDERFVAVCQGFAPDRPHPAPKRGLFSLGQKAPNRGETGAAHLRLQAVRDAVGMQDQEFTELPASATGYTVALSSSRVFVFDGGAKRYLTETPTEGIWLQPVDHGDGSSTLVFMDGEERVGVTTRRDSVELTDHFVESFPDRRGQARVLHATGHAGIAEF